MLSRRVIMSSALVIATVVALALVWRIQFSGTDSPGLPKIQPRLAIPSASLRAPEGLSEKGWVSNASIPTRATTTVDRGADAKGLATVDVANLSKEAAGPLVVPASISAACNDSGIKAGRICNRLYDDLAQIAKEARDPAWASDMEIKLQSYIEERFKDASIHNIDCRSSFC